VAVRTIGAVPKSKPQPLAAAVRRADAAQASPAARGQALGSLAWPVQGRIVRAYGTQPSGARNDGLDIGAAAGAFVHAVAEGVVSYAGSDLPGYGKMLLLAHGDGFTSVYAHNASLLVAVGARVGRGQPIATVGRSGTLAAGGVHFQLRAGDRPVDPVAYLEPQVTVVASLAPAGAIGAR
jgi:septal ring factor EnvC (AmiA/AmiB activator)